MNSSHHWDELCQAPFRVAVAVAAPVQAGVLKLGDSATLTLRAVAVTGVFVASVHLPLSVFLVTDTRAVADSLGEPQPRCVGLGIFFSGKTKVKENKRESASVGYCLRCSFLWASCWALLLIPNYTFH